MRRGDKILVGVLAAVLLFGVYIYFLRPAAPPESVIVVQVDGVDKHTFPLYQEGRDEYFDVQGVNGITKLHLSGDRVRVVESACPDKICVHTGWTDNPAKPIACLPNRVIVKIVGDSGDGVDLR